MYVRRRIDKLKIPFSRTVIQSKKQGLRCSIKKIMLSSLVWLQNKLLFTKRFPSYATRKINDRYFMFLTPQTKGLNQELYLRGRREPHTTDLFEKYLDATKPSITLDAGANIGYYALLEAYYSDEVVALEPDKNNFYMLNHNVELNGLKNIETFNCALGHKVGRALFYRSEISNWHTTKKPATHNPIIDVTVTNMETLDNLCGKLKLVPDVVRMDVEGFEYEILLGAKKTVEKYKPSFLIELHTSILKTSELEKIFKLFDENGYCVEWLVFEDNIDLPFKTSPSRVCYQPSFSKAKRICREIVVDPQVLFVNKKGAKF